MGEASAFPSMEQSKSCLETRCHVSYHSKSASPLENSISEILARCSKPSSINRNTNTFGNASAEFGVYLVEVLELSLDCSAVTLTKVSSDVIHGRLSHLVIENFVEKRAWLLIVGVGVNVLISSNWASNLMSMDSILLVLFWTRVLSWLIVRGLSITSSDVHDTITLVISIT